MRIGWQKLIPTEPVFRGEGNYRIDAYSEFTPSPLVGWKPYGDGTPDPDLFSNDDHFGWQIGAFEEALELRTGLIQIGRQVLTKLGRLLDGNPETGLPKLDLLSNPFWPPELANEMKLPHERCLTLLPLSLSRTQDDKGRVRWTVFGNSEQGPGRAFWKGFFTSPNAEIPTAEAIGFFCRLLRAVYGECAEDADSLHKAGFRILPDYDPLVPLWKEELPSWTAKFLLPDRPRRDAARYLLTFRPFGRLPAGIQKAYLAGTLNLLPFPGSLTYWGVAGYRQLHRELPLALQIPLLLGLARHRMPEGLRVPQSGFLYEPTAERPHPSPHHTSHIRNTYKRTHRWDKILRDEDELALIEREDKLLHVLFSTIPDDLSLYDKPMARNVQLWTEDSRLLLDGPNATPAELKLAMRTVQAGGLFGYRFQFPAMRVGRYEVYWHRPLVAYRDRSGEPMILPEAPSGYLTAYDTKKPRLDRAIELWPRFRQRPVASAALTLSASGSGLKPGPLLRGVRKLLDAVGNRDGAPLPRPLARQLLARGPAQTLDGWLSSLPESLRVEVCGLIASDRIPLPRSRGSTVPSSMR